MIIRRTSKYSSGKTFTEYWKRCKYCLQEKWFSKKHSLYCSINCSSQDRKIKNPLEVFFREKITRLRSNAKKRNKIFNITWEDLFNQYNLQKGKCYYTDIEMRLSYSAISEKICPFDQLSVDRKDSSKGYVKDNIVLCLFCINNFKGEMTILEFKNIIEKIKINDNKI